MKTTRPLPLLLCLAGLGGLLAAPLASAVPPPPPGAEAPAPDEDGPPEPPGHEGRPEAGWDADAPARRFRGPPPGAGGMPVLRLLRGLDLSPQQRDSIHATLEKNREPHRSLITRRMALQRAFAELDPVAPDYRQKADRLAADAAKLAQETVRFDARVTSEVVAQLKPEQAKALQSRMAERQARQAERRKQRCESEAHS